MRIYADKMSATRRQMVVKEDTKNDGTSFVLDLEVRCIPEELKELIGEETANPVWAGCVEREVPGGSAETVWVIQPTPTNFVCGLHEFEIDDLKFETEPKLNGIKTTDGERSVRVMIRLIIVDVAVATYFVTNRRCTVSCSPIQNDIEEERELPENARQMSLGEAPKSPHMVLVKKTEQPPDIMEQLAEDGNDAAH